MSADLENLIEDLRVGVVPNRGLAEFAIGIGEQAEAARAVVGKAAKGEGAVRFIRGPGGSGKSYLSKLIVEAAQAQGLATAFTVVSQKGYRFHELGSVLIHVVKRLATTEKRRRAFAEHHDDWLQRAEESPSLSLLSDMLGVIRDAGHPGLVIIVEDADAILNMRRSARSKALNGIRQIVESTADFPGLIWVFSGTAAFFDDRRGVSALPELHTRISADGLVIDLPGFDEARLRAAAQALRDVYPTENREAIVSAIDDRFIGRLIVHVTDKFGGEPSEVPRKFLRQLITHLDMLDEDDTYDPNMALGFDRYAMTEATTDPLGVIRRIAMDEEGPLPSEDVW